ncbi:transglycosylase family protein [Streptomyces sp. Je 1-332]|uniref:LysM peptidoglycan-binding domain-containing protein n=1 Tax=Streptomyces sp. Je 1-332 TaxID=3231270 RepID=UPI003457DDBC
MYPMPIKSLRSLWPAGLVVAAVSSLLLPVSANAAPAPPRPLPGSVAGAYDCSRTEGAWSCLAKCESTSRWNANTGNGFYGGLQFKQSTWEEFGGRKYAPRADLATKAEQIKVAEKVLRVQGWNAWPVCSKKIPKEIREGWGIVHVVKAGETLSSIARRYDVKGGWKALYQANRKEVGAKPDRLAIGTELVIPKKGAKGSGATEAKKQPKQPELSKQPKPSPSPESSKSQESSQTPEAGEPAEPSASAKPSASAGPGVSEKPGEPGVSEEPAGPAESGGTAEPDGSAGPVESGESAKPAAPVG